MLRRSPTSLALAPARRLRPARYLIIASHEGMFGDRDFSYLTVAPPQAAVTPIAGASRRSVPAVSGSLLPVAAALLALLFTILLLRSFRRRRAGEKLLWAGGFVLFAVATACEAVAQGSGWSPGLFRGYYLCGGVLTVAWLGAGSAWLQLPRRARDALVGGLLGGHRWRPRRRWRWRPCTASALAHVPSGGPPADGALGGHAFLWAIALNSFGTAFLWVARSTRSRAGGGCGPTSGSRAARSCWRSPPA